MRNKLVQICLLAICLTTLGAAQEALPAFGGAKAPLLGILALYLSARPRRKNAGGPIGLANRARTETEHVAFVCIVGLFEDALCGLPAGCCLGAALLTHLTVRLADAALAAPPLPSAAFGAIAAAALAPCREIWLGIWGETGPGPSAFVRFFAAALPAALAGAILFPALARLERFAGTAGGER